MNLMVTHRAFLTHRLRDLPTTKLQITSVRSRSELPRTTNTDQDSMSRSRLEREIEKLVVSFTALKVKVDSNIPNNY